MWAYIAVMLPVQFTVTLYTLFSIFLYPFIYSFFFSWSISLPWRIKECKKMWALCSELFHLHVRNVDGCWRIWNLDNLTVFFFVLYFCWCYHFFLYCWKLVPDSLIVNFFVRTYFGMKLHLGRVELLLCFLFTFYNHHSSILC